LSVHEPGLGLEFCRDMDIVRNGEKEAWATRSFVTDLH
jgi:hypothetical protein